MGPESIKKRDKEASIQKLLAAGVKVFSTYGYDAATTKRIAQEAGMNESLISRYFDGKAGLLVEIIRSFIEKECDHGTLKNYPEGDTLEAEMLHFFSSKLKHYLAVKPFLKVVFSRAIIDPKVAKEVQIRTAKGSASKLLERLRALQTRGQIRADVDVEKTCFTINNTCFSMGFFGHTVMGLDKDYIWGALTDFARDFSKGLST
ncbi:MAG: TetR/AcrR family transcriptional regulator [Candidatus Margulisiibacteriota bacterium]